MKRGHLICLLVALAVAFPSAGAAHANPQNIYVTITDKGCKVTPAQVGFGNTHFNVVNKGKLRHGFSFTGHKTGFLRPGQKALIDLDFLRPGSYRYFCTTPKRTSFQGRFRIGDGSAPKWGENIKLTQIGSFPGAVIVASPPGDAKRLVVGQLDGPVYLLKDGVRQSRPFLDLRGIAHHEGERGLLGLAFAPDYQQSGLLYVYYNDPAANLHLVEYRRSQDPDVVDPASARELLYLPKFSSHHNGGYLQFGPDGYLYVFTGDGGDSYNHPPGEYGQRVDDLFGSILRINPRQRFNAPYSIPSDNPFVGRTDARPEVWAYGLRNPWRGFIDANGDVYVSDVGPDQWEEVNLIPSGVKGANLGWPCFEGPNTYRHGLDLTCPEDALKPVFSYRNDPTTCAIIGGVVARDPRLGEIKDYFLYADLCSGNLSRLSYGDGRAAVFPLGITVSNPISFGTDALNRIYIATAPGPVYRLDPQ